MKHKHVLAALWLACGIVSSVHAQESGMQADVPAAMPQPVAQDVGASDMVQQNPTNTGASADIASSTNMLHRVDTGHLSARIDEASTMKAGDTENRIDNLLRDIKATDMLIALFAGMLVLIAWVQARRLRVTVSAVRETALAAGKSARLAENALVSGQRAFMFIREIKTFLHFDAASNQYQWSIHPIWENSGNTPTRELMTNTTYHVADKPLPADYDFPHAEKDLLPTIAGPKTMIEAAPGGISSEDLAAVQNGTKYFYIWGWAEYRDVFEGTQKHVTRFCNQLTHVIGDTTAPISERNMVQMMFSFHAENNYAD